jgi:hypothetical protein
MANPHRHQPLQGLARQTGRQAGRLALSPAQPEGRSAGGHGGAPAAASALHTVSKCDPKTGNQGVSGSGGGSGCRDGGLAGLPLDPPTPWLDGSYTRSGFRLPGPVGATRSPPAGTRGLSRSPPASTRGSHPVTACQHPWDHPERALAEALPGTREAGLPLTPVATMEAGRGGKTPCWITHRVAPASALAGVWRRGSRVPVNEAGNPGSRATMGSMDPTESSRWYWLLGCPCRSRSLVP